MTDPSSRRPAPPSSLPRKTTSSSGQHRLELNDTLASHSEQIAKGKESFATKSPSPLPPNPVPNIRDSQVDPEEAEADIREATGKFVAGIDTITDALFLILGQFDHALKAIRLGIVLAALAFLAQGYAIYRIESLTAKLAEEQQKSTALKDELITIKNEMVGVKVEQTAAKDKIDEVAQTQAEEAKKPDITIVADKASGNAKVVIKSRPAPTGTGVSSAPPPAAIELPLKLPPDAKVVDSPKETQQAPVPEPKR